MRTFSHRVAGFLLATTFLCASGQLATGQTLKFNTSTTAAQGAPLSPSSNPQYIASTATMQTIEFVPNGATFVRWIVEGDLAYETGYSSSTNTPSGQPLIKVKSQAMNASSTLYGKGRVSVEYYYNVQNGNLQCNGVDILCNGDPFPNNTRTYGKVSFDLFKKFTTWTAPNTIVGPTCLPISGAVTYSINSIVTKDPQIQSGIGTDTYYWKVATTTAPGTPLALTYAAGDKSSITFTPTANTSYIVSVIVGQGNTATPTPNPGTPDFNTGTNPAVKTVTASAGAPVPTIANIPCLTTTSSSFTFTLPVTNGITYDVQVPPSWGRTNPTYSTYPFTATATANLVFTVTVDQHGGNVIVKSTGACGGTTTQVLPVNRQLVYSATTPQPTGTQSLTNPGCFANSNATSISMTLNNAPANTLLLWTLPTSPSGWAITTSGAVQTDAVNNVWRAPATVAISVPAGHSGGTVKVNAEACASTVAQEVKRTLAVTGALTCAGTYTITRSVVDPGPPIVYSDYQFNLASTGGATCLPTGANTYTWQELTGPGGSVVQSKTSPVNAVTFDNPVASPGTATIKVIISGTNCLSYTVEQSSLRPAAGTGGIRPTTTSEQRALRQANALTVYPNPANGQLRVVTETGTTATLTLLDQTGRLVRQLETRQAETTLPVSDVPNGSYWLRAVLSTGEIVNRAVQVQH